MPIEKFRSIEEMNRATPRRATRGDIEAFFRHCARYWALAPKVYPRGVFRLRSVDEAEHLTKRHRLRD